MNIRDAKRIADRCPPHADRPETQGRAGHFWRALNVLLADMFALYVKTKNFHWHISGPHFRDYHLLLDEQGEQIFATTDAIAERVRKLGGTTLRSIGHICRLQRLLDNDADFVTPLDMLAELRDDNKQLTSRTCARRMTFATSTATSPAQACWKTGSMRPSGAHWFLFEATRAD